MRAVITGAALAALATFCLAQPPGEPGLEAFADIFAKAKSPQWTEQTRIHVTGDVAILSGIYVNRRNDGEERRSRYTDTWLRRNGKWRVLASQLTALEEKGK